MSTDPLLDDATRYGERFKNVPVGVMVLALIERVREAEAERQEWADLWQQTSMSVLQLMDERDAAEGKLDKVRAALTGRAPHSQVARDVLAILEE